MNNLNVAILTIGCRLNQAESDSLLNEFLRYGFIPVQDYHQAHIIVINTCTVTAKGDRDARKLVRKIHRELPQAQIAVIGCQAQLQFSEIAQWEGVQWIVGNQEKFNLVQLIMEHPHPISPYILVSPISQESFTVPAPSIGWHTRAYLKIQDGCNCQCSYCTIPAARGPSRSRIYQDLINEAHHLLEKGFREIILTGINIANYYFEGKTLLDVIQALCSYNQLQRLRLSSIEPGPILQSLPQIFHFYPRKICRHLHLALQSGSQRILTLMNRSYPLSTIIQTIQYLSSQIAFLCIGLDVIVGFPGETEEDFQQTYETITQLPVAYGHVFSFSERPNTPITQQSHLPRISPSEIQRRSRDLRALFQQKKESFLTRILEQEGTVEVLVEQYQAGYWIGHTDHYILTKIQAKPDCNFRNQIIRVKLHKKGEDYLVGEPILSY